MPNMEMQNSSSEQSVVLDQFKGVDFSSSLSDVRPYRSPDSLNMIAVGGGKPVKRFGYEQLSPALSGRINGIHCLKLDAGDVILVHHGTSLSVWEEGKDPVTKYTAAANTKSMAFQIDGKLFIVDGKAPLYFDGSVVKLASELAYVPITARGGMPSKVGAAYESINLLSGKRRNIVRGDGETKVFKVDATGIDSTGLKGEVYNYSSRKWETVFVSISNAANGEVQFGTAPIKCTDNTGNVRITYSKQYAGGAGMINGCTIGAVWDYGGEARLFLSGNKSYPNQDFQCVIKQAAEGETLADGPLYFPLSGQTAFGTDASAVMGYLQVGESLGIVKESEKQNATVYLRQASKTVSNSVVTVQENTSAAGTDVSDSTGKTNNDNNTSNATTNNSSMSQNSKETETNEVATQFMIKKGVASAGAVSKGCMCMLRDDPLFLSGEGVFAIETNSTNAAQYTQPRSELINKKLCAETGLADAVATEFQGRLYLAVNGNVYVADSAMRHTDGMAEGKFQYEWYFWTGWPQVDDETEAGYRKDIPVNVWFSHGGKLMFGTADGKIMRFFDTVEKESFYDDGQPIFARWTTPVLDFDTYSMYKNVSRIYTQMQPYLRSGVRISMKLDGKWQEVDKKDLDIFSFEDIDFSRFSFNMDHDIGVIATKIKKKRVKVTQLCFENKEPGEGMGLYSVTVYYTKTRKVK